MNFKKAVIFFGCAAPVCALLNCLVMFFTIESSSGFFRTGYASLAWLMLGLMGVLTVLSAVAFANIRPAAEPWFWPIVACISSLILGVCFGLEAYNFVPLVGTSALFATVIRIFGFLSAIVFVWRALSCIYFVPMVKPLYIIPIIYFLVKVVSSFIAYAGVATITETAFELFSICAMLIFLLHFAKRENGIVNKKGRHHSRPVSIACAILILAQIAPYAANCVLKENILLHANALFIPTSIAMFLFITVTSLFRDEKTETEE